MYLMQFYVFFIFVGYYLYESYVVVVFWIYVGLNFKYEVGEFFFCGGDFMCVGVVWYWCWGLFYQVIQYMVNVEVI